MSYEKITLEIPTIADALAEVAPDEASQSALLAAGCVVQLDTGARVWVSCCAADNPSTYRIEFATVAIAVNADGSILSGVSPRAFMHGVLPELVEQNTPDAIRKDLMLVALGETPLLDGIAPPSAERSIRTAITVAEQLAAAPADVL